MCKWKHVTNRLSTPNSDLSKWKQVTTRLSTPSSGRVETRYKHMTFYPNDAIVWPINVKIVHFQHRDNLRYVWCLFYLSLKERFWMLNKGYFPNAKRGICLHECCILWSITCLSECYVCNVSLNTMVSLDRQIRELSLITGEGLHVSSVTLRLIINHVTQKSSQRMFGMCFPGKNMFYK